MHTKFGLSSLVFLVCSGSVLAVLAGCSTPPKPLYQTEQFDSKASPFARDFDATAAGTCQAARRALLSQGYMTTSTRFDLVDGSKNFQPDSDSHVTIEFHVVCTSDDPDSPNSTAYVSAVQDRYTLKKSTTSASVGLSVLGSLSLPIGSSDDEMVKIASETIPAGVFYDRFFNLVKYYIATAPEKPAAVKPPPPPPPMPEPIKPVKAPASGEPASSVPAAGAPMTTAPAAEGVPVAGTIKGGSVPAQAPVPASGATGAAIAPDAASAAAVSVAPAAAAEVAPALSPAPASIPKLTLTPATADAASTPAGTFTPAVTSAPTVSSGPTATSTPTITSAPQAASTPTITSAPQANPAAQDSLAPVQAPALAPEPAAPAATASSVAPANVDGTPN